MSLITPTIRRIPQYDNPFPRVFILGIGPVARYLAFGLSQHCPTLPISLIVYNEKLLRLFRALPDPITYTDPDGVLQTLTNSKGNIPWGNHALSVKSGYKLHPGLSISHLIVVNQGGLEQTARDLYPLRRRLHPKSTVVFMQQTPGVVDNDFFYGRLFPDVGFRPQNIWYGKVKTDVRSLRDPRPFYENGTVPSEREQMEKPPGEKWEKWLEEVATEGGGSPLGIKVCGKREKIGMEIARAERGLVPPEWFEDVRRGERPKGWGAMPFLVEKLVEAELFKTKVRTGEEMKVDGLRKLAIDTIVGCLSVLFRCENGELLKWGRPRIMHALVNELAPVLEKMVPSGAGHEARRKFTPAAIRALITTYISLTPGQHTRMLKQATAEEYRHKTTSAVRETMGYIVDKGKGWGMEVSSLEEILGLLRRGETVRRVPELQRLLRKVPFDFTGGVKSVGFGAYLFEEPKGEDNGTGEEGKKGVIEEEEEEEDEDVKAAKEFMKSLGFEI